MKISNYDRTKLECLPQLFTSTPAMLELTKVDSFVSLYSSIVGSQPYLQILDQGGSEWLWQILQLITLQQQLRHKKFIVLGLYVPIIGQKYQTRLKRPARDKHSSLFVVLFSNEERNFQKVYTRLGNLLINYKISSLKTWTKIRKET